jgi:RNA polymerase sigma-70 factor (ECF subfamily)
MAQADNQKRFEAIVKEYSDDLFRYTYWLCRDKNMAEELVQEAFLRAWKSIDSLREDKAAKSWLITIVRREYARQFERAKLPMTDVEDLGVLPERSAEYDTSTEAFVLRRALADLPEDYREPLVLQVIGGYSSEEIAEIMGIKAGAVMTRLFRARQKLREVLTGGDGAESPE